MACGWCGLTLRRGEPPEMGGVDRITRRYGRAVRRLEANFAIAPPCPLTYMAFVDRACRGAGLQSFGAYLTVGRLAWRYVYASDDFLEWMENDLPLIRASDETQPTPKAQLDTALTRFCDGVGLAYGSNVRSLEPHDQSVWELKAPDLRLFSWFSAKNYLVMHRGEDANYLHQDRSRYTPLIESTVHFRGSLVPPVPGPIRGVRLEYVVSNRA